MQKLAEVESAKALMTEAVDWSVVKWLGEKKRVRKAADQANLLLDKTSDEIKAAWSKELKAAYDNLVAGTDVGKASQELKLLAKQVKELDDDAHRLRNEAEEIFDKAERRLSTSLAREGCRKAIEGWEQHLKAILKAETGLSSKSSTR